MTCFLCSWIVSRLEELKCSLGSWGIINMNEQKTEMENSLVNTLTKNRQQELKGYHQQLPELSINAVEKLTISLKDEKFDAKPWVQWFLMIKSHSTFAQIESLFLKYHLWSELDLKSLQQLEQLLFQYNYVELLAWCGVVFDCTYVTNNTKNTINEALPLFLMIVQQLHKVGLATGLPNLPKRYHVFTYGLEPLKALAFVVQNVKSEWLSIQLSLLASLPNIDDAKILLKEGFCIVCLEMLERKTTKLTVNINECIELHIDLVPLCTSVLRYTVKHQTKRLLEVYPQIKHLIAFRPDEQELDKDDIALIAKNYWRGFFAQNNLISVATVLVWGDRVKNTLGVAAFLGVFDRPAMYQAKTLSELSELCQLLIELEEDSKIDLVNELDKQQSVTQLVQLLVDERRRYYQEIYQQKSLEEAIRDFKTPNPPFVRFPLSEKIIGELKQEYLKIEELGKKIGQMAEPQLQQAIIELKNTFAQTKLEQRRPLVLQALAMIREQVLRHFKILPYNTQILSLLALTRDVGELKGNIGQIGTGEGKSITVCMLATVHGLQGYCVDVITSSRELATRDQKKFAPFFTFFGLTSSHICYDHPKKEHFRGQIIYATNYDFEFSMMRDPLFGSELRYSEIDGKLQPRRADVAIVDEADNLFIDAANNSARLAVSSPLDYSWVYPLIAQYVQKQNQAWQLSQSELQQVHKSCELFRQQHHSNKPKATEKQITTWINSAKRAFFELMLNKDYVMEWVIDPQEQERGLQPKISIVDYQNTGRINTGSRWQNGLHEFVEIKHGIVPKKEGLTAASMSHPSFFAYYTFIFGLTGTIGEEIERNEIQQVYQVSTFDVPRHRPSQRKQLPATLCLDQKQHHKKLFGMAVRHSSQGQPVLILVRTIQESINLSEFFKENKTLHQVLNEKQAEDEEYIVGRAGISGVITIATNTAGRGTDIILSSDSKKAGGLHVIFAFYPANTRVEDQGLGRAGRQGQQGSCCLLMRLDDDEIIRLVPEMQQRQLLFKNSELIKVLNQKRTEKISSESQSRKLRSAIDTTQHDLLKNFFALKKLLFVVMGKIPLTQLSTLLIKELKQQPQCKPLVIESDELSYQQIVQQKLLIYINQNSWENSKWEELLLQAVKAYQEKLSEEWALFFTALDKGDEHPRPTSLELMPLYQGLLKERFLKFVEEKFANVLQNTTSCFVNFIFELIGCESKLVISKELSVDGAKEYQELLKQFNKVEVSPKQSQEKVKVPLKQPGKKAEPPSKQPGKKVETPPKLPKKLVEVPLKQPEKKVCLLSKQSEKKVEAPPKLPKKVVGVPLKQPEKKVEPQSEQPEKKLEMSPKQSVKIKVPPKQPVKMESPEKRINKSSTKMDVKNMQAFFLERIEKSKGENLAVPVKKIPPSDNAKIKNLN